MKYRVRFEIDEKVDADSCRDAVNEAIDSVIGGGWSGDDLICYIWHAAEVEEINEND